MANQQDLSAIFPIEYLKVLLYGCEYLEELQLKYECSNWVAADTKDKSLADVPQLPRLKKLVLNRYVCGQPCITFQG
jgi:hypothetical protein